MRYVKRRRAGKKPKFVELSTTFPVFSNFKVSIFFSPEIRQTAFWVADRDYTGDHESTETAEAFTVSGHGFSNIYFNPNARPGIIAHEAYHAVTNLLKMVDAQEEHEVVAYHLGYLVDLVIKFQEKTKGRFK